MNAKGAVSMKNLALAFAGVVLATSIAVAQSAPPTQQQTPPPQQQTPPPQTPQTQKAPEISLTGCIIQGSAPSIFLFSGAKKDPDDAKEIGQTYFLVADAADLNFKPHLNHSVRLTGTAELKTPPVVPPGGKVAEKDLLKFTAKSATMVSDRCPA
jgi:hypothetical protein